MFMLKLIKLLIYSSLFFKSLSAEIIWFSDSIKKNQKGKIIQTYSGKVFKLLLGDNITAMLWLPDSSLRICGPNILEYQGN